MKKLLIGSILSMSFSFTSMASIYEYGNCKRTIYAHLTQEEINSFDAYEQGLAEVVEEVEKVVYNSETEEIQIFRVENDHYFFGLLNSPKRFTLKGKFIKTIDSEKALTDYTTQDNYLLTSTEGSSLEEAFPGVSIDSEVGLFDVDSEQIIIDFSAGHKRVAQENPDMDWRDLPGQEQWYKIVDGKKVSESKHSFVSGAAYTCKTLD